jgi:phosphoglucomutase
MSVSRRDGRSDIIVVSQRGRRLFERRAGDKPLGRGAGAIGDLKVVAESGWFAARPFGTENIYKIYAESFRDLSHLDAIVGEADEIVSNALGASTDLRSIKRVQV